MMAVERVKELVRMTMVYSDGSMVILKRDEDGNFVTERRQK